MHHENSQMLAGNEHLLWQSVPHRLGGHSLYINVSFRHDSRREPLCPTVHSH